MPTEPTPAQWQQIEADVFARRTIQAIKRYREVTGAELKEAKDAIDARAAQLREKSPDQFAPQSGCLGVIVLMTTLAALVGALAHSR